MPYLETPEHSHLSQGRHTRRASRRRRSGRRRGWSSGRSPTPKRSSGPSSRQYCFECHNRDDLAGDRAFDRMSPDRIAADAETWELAIRKLRGGLMPPAGGPRPDGETLDELAAWLADEIDAAADEPPAGRVSLRRLNRREYAHAIRDLLALEVDPAALLPQDNVDGYFDNNADALQVSPAFVSQYIDAARAIALEAVGDAKALPIATQYGDPANMVISLPPDGAPGHGPATASSAGHAVRHARRLRRQAQLPRGRRVRAHDRRHGARARSAAHGVREHRRRAARRQGALSHEDRRRSRSQGHRPDARSRRRGDQRPVAQDSLQRHGRSARPRRHVRAPQLRRERRAHANDRRSKAARSASRPRTRCRFAAR